MYCPVFDSSSQNSHASSTLLCADQPDIFLQRLLKQTRSYLSARGPEAVKKFEEGFREATDQAAAAVEQGRTNASHRDIDL